MMAQAIITHITALPSDPNHRSVVVDGKRIATLRASDVDALHLRAGLAWTATLAAAVEREVLANKARKKAMNLLGRRMYSRGELLNRLIRSKHPLPIAERIVDELVADQWLDDAEYARDVVRSLTRVKPASRQLILAKLKARQIEGDLAIQIADETCSADAALDQAVQLGAAQMNKMKDSSARTRTRRIASLLARRGFDEQIIAEACERLGIADGSAPDQEQHVD